jgi:hypothetical protein
MNKKGLSFWLAFRPIIFQNVPSISPFTEHRQVRHISQLRVCVGGGGVGDARSLSPPHKIARGKSFYSTRFAHYTMYYTSIHLICTYFADVDFFQTLSTAHMGRGDHVLTFIFQTPGIARLILNLKIPSVHSYCL